MNYLIFKSINSDTIQGLIIQELPPITKPEMRVETTVIEGKDGDIQEELGYSAYDKTLRIGLSRNFDINQIIKYFSGSGNIIFSNEPNKMYKANIVKQIDYDRLVAFRTANVKIHVQPYKYLLNEVIQDITIKNQTSIIANNVGLEKSKPIITLYGTGIIEFKLKGVAIFQINIDDNYVIVDSENQEAFKENVLKNNMMVGEFPILEVGVNTITWTGTLTRIIIEPKSRWL